MPKKTAERYVADFETTVYNGQDHTEVWAAALVKLKTEDVSIYHSIDEFMQALFDLKQTCIVYFHNLKFDGTFIIYWLIHNNYKLALQNDHWKKTKLMSNNEYSYMISSKGQFYTLTIKKGKYTITFQDSLKLLPFSVKAMGKAFNTKHQKLDMEYVGYRYAGCEITDSEKEYIKNDVLVVKECLEIMFSKGHNKITIGSCCLSEFKFLYGYDRFNENFPCLAEIPTPDYFKERDVDAFVRKSYKGGWCYVVPEKTNKVFEGIGVTADVNSLYPSMMYGDSDNYYPYGQPQFWQGELPQFLNDNLATYYFIRIRTRFNIKPNYLPTIQIKGNLLYSHNEWLTTSDIKNVKTGKYYDKYIDFDGTVKPAIVELTLTKTDYELMKDHYILSDTEELYGVYFKASRFMFDEYIEKYRDLKLNAKNSVERTLAKLFLNNLYGKFSTSRDSSFKVARLGVDDSVKWDTIFEQERKTVYVAVGSAITSYARNFTIRAAQANYYGADKRGFIYADTDSIHCDLSPDELKNIPVDPKAFSHWKLETTWDKAIFVRQKTYIEHVVAEDLEPVDNPYNNIKCAGMNDRCKELLNASIEGTAVENPTERELVFLSKHRDYHDFKVGLTVPSKIMARNIKGGVLLMSTDYQMH